MIFAPFFNIIIFIFCYTTNYNIHISFFISSNLILLILLNKYFSVVVVCMGRVDVTDPATPPVNSRCWLSGGLKLFCDSIIAPVMPAATSIIIGMRIFALRLRASRFTRIFFLNISICM